MNVVPGNMFEHGLDIIVVTVNCVGVMGRGNALEFRNREPDLYQAYRKQCQAGYITPGSVSVLSRNGRAYLLFATKDHFRDPSRYEWILNGLRTIRDFAQSHPERTINMPPPGAGLGGLDPEVVYHLADSVLRDCPNVYYHLPQ